MENIEESKADEGISSSSSSDEDQDKRNEERESYKTTLVLTGELLEKMEVEMLLICMPATSQALSHVLFHDRMTEIAKAETSYHK